MEKKTHPGSFFPWFCNCCWMSSWFVAFPLFWLQPTLDLSYVIWLHFLIIFQISVFFQINKALSIEFQLLVVGVFFGGVLILNNCVYDAHVSLVKHLTTFCHNLFPCTIGNTCKTIFILDNNPYFFHRRQQVPDWDRPRWHWERARLPITAC